MAIARFLLLCLAILAIPRSGNAVCASGNECASKLQGYGVLDFNGQGASKLQGYGVLDRAGEGVSKLQGYAVLNFGGVFASKIQAYAVLCSNPGTPPCPALSSGIAGSLMLTGVGN